LLLRANSIVLLLDLWQQFVPVLLLWQQFLLKDQHRASEGIAPALASGNAESTCKEATGFIGNFRHSGCHMVYRFAYSPIPSGQRGRPCLRIWPQRLIAQVVKRYEKRRVVDVERRIARGAAARVEKGLTASQGAGVINTAYIERLNTTLRERLESWTRRGQALARKSITL
jgi:hypothetical protein